MKYSFLVHPVFFRLAALVLVFPAVSASAAPSCDALKSLKLPDASIVSARLVPAGSFTPSRGGADGSSTAQAALPAHCNVVLTVKQAVTVEVWLPAEGWNGKIATVGDGGTAGFINYSAMIPPLKLGYATASTDTGHLLASEGMTASNVFSWAYGHPELLVDYGYRAIHEMTLKTKKVVESFYGRAAQRNYFIGCSNAGRQALMEVQRYPEDYDGVLSGAPLVSWTNWVSENALWDALALSKTDNYVPASKLPLIADAAMKACDAKDGIKDGIINNPTKCHFDPAVLLCKAEDSTDCLTAKQVETVKKIYAGPIVNGKAIYPGYMPGSEGAWGFAIGTAPGVSPAHNFAQGFFRDVVYGDQSWNLEGWNPAKDLPAAKNKVGGVLDAVNPNIGPFQAHGGKLIIYHGWADPTLAPVNTVNYYKRVETTIKDPDDTVRLFMVPGMYHCSGGTGPYKFDAFDALVKWVEEKRAPNRIIASNAPEAPIKRTRPLCPYPKAAEYTGHGSTDDAANFVCRLPVSP